MIKKNTPLRFQQGPVSGVAISGFKLLVMSLALLVTSKATAETDLKLALKRAQYLLTGTFPQDSDFAQNAVSEAAYRSAVRNFINHPNYYNQMLRYHERLFGTGLPLDYLDELIRDDIDNKTAKVAKLQCQRVLSAQTGKEALNCNWSNGENNRRSQQGPNCPDVNLIPASVFWYPGVTAWVCPSVVQTCGADLSRCFIEYSNADEAKNSELGTTEIFDSRYAVVKSLSRQASGIATMVAFENYPYKNILKPGLTAIDGAIAHFYRQSHHFDLEKLNLSSDFLNLVNSISLTDTRFRLVNSGNPYEHAGVLTTFAWLRRYEKDRTRANQLYERLLCQKFTSDPPKVFPADPGNLRETPGCNGCHATLDPLADFFKVWGEGGELYTGAKETINTTFNGKTGTSMADLSAIIVNDDAFATCTVQNVWKWLMGRTFYRNEADLRRALTDYFITTNYSFNELVYALATHPGFLDGARSDATIGDPLEKPPLGQLPGGNVELTCNKQIDFATDIQPKLTQCTSCHNSSATARQDLSTQASWLQWGSQAVSMMTSGNMPPGQAGPPLIGPVFDLKEAVRCWMEQN